MDVDSRGPLLDYKHSIYSQFGEDGVIAEILRRIDRQPPYVGTCVEFGAWDGIRMSNTFALVEQGWKAVYIEGDRRKFDELLKTCQSHPSITPINAFVDRYPGSITSIDSLLSGTDIPVDFDLLSIDIDSYDLDVWESLQKYHPKIVIIEVNSRVLPGILWRHGPRTLGNSFTSTQNVALDKGYSLVCHTGANSIFVRNDFIQAIGLEVRYYKFPELLFDDSWLPNFREREYISRKIISMLPRWALPFFVKVKAKVSLLRKKFVGG